MIPKIAHFIWFGSELPWMYGLAIRSAALRGGFDRVVLHSEDNLEHTPGYAMARDVDSVSWQRLDPEALIKKLGPGWSGLIPLYRRLEQPAARSNLIRAVLLALEGGVYLDTDTVTVSSFEPCLQSGVFCGVEHIVLPHDVVTSRNPAVWLRAGALLAVRDVLRRAPRGYRAFRLVDRFYVQAVNNAVLGAEAGHELIFELLRQMLQMPPKEQLVRFALGTHLLEKTVAAYPGDDLTIHPPSRFYPLAPEISEHWFRMRSDCALGDVVADDTISVHWYASVRTKKLVPLIDNEYVRRHGRSQLWSALALPFVQ